MIEVIPVTIIPRYGCVSETIYKLEEIGNSFKTKYHEETKTISSVVVNIAKDNLHKLLELREIVDIMALSSVEATILDQSYQSRIFQNLRVYSPRFENHRGEMSGNGKSDATYHGIITRDNKINNKPVKLLLQFIKPNAKTSNHYHKKTIEFFLPLLGKTLLYCNKVGEIHPKIQNLKDFVFTKIMPRTAHQLRTKNTPCVNLLCMEPYDPRLRDHFYVNS